MEMAESRARVGKEQNKLRKSFASKSRNVLLRMGSSQKNTGASRKQVPLAKLAKAKDQNIEFQLTTNY